MRRVLRKQDRNDFNSRIKRLDPAFAAMPATARVVRQPWELEKSARGAAEHPVMMSALGCGLALSAMYAADDPDSVRELLVWSGWPVQFLTYAMTGISILIIGLIIFYLASMIRIVNPRATGRRNAAGLVVGAIAAIGVMNLDPAHVEAGFQYAGLDGPGDLLILAQEQSVQLANVDWGSVVMVSSSAK